MDRIKTKLHGRVALFAALLIAGLLCGCSASKGERSSPSDRNGREYVPPEHAPIDHTPPPREPNY